MGEMISNSTKNISEKVVFAEHLIDDIKALQILLDKNLFEDDIVRIGAEQELCLVNAQSRPVGINLKLLEAIGDSHFTTELASYNIEINLDPFELKRDCFSLVEKQLRQLMELTVKKAEKFKARPILAGILPTIGKKEVGLDHLTPIPRYLTLNERLKKLKGGDFNLKIRGVDELYLNHDSVMFEACNTSFQTHLQVPSYDFVASYNWAQAIAGPVLSVCCNSPLLMGKELWKETRIALFQQSLDTRKTTYTSRDQTPRVGFGNSWEQKSVVEIFKNDISKHRIVLSKPIEQYSSELLERGKIPKLSALSLHNGTVYRWNRACYGVGGGKPHLRIENRYLPAGPSVLDEMANFAFWVGLMKGRPKKFDDMPSQMDFKTVKTNFIKAARTGKETLFSWCGKHYTAEKLVLNELLPIAYKGLHKCNIDDGDVERLLGIIEARALGRTGEQWQINNFRKLKEHYKTDTALELLTRSTMENQIKNVPIHQWEDIQLESIVHTPRFVKEIMSTHLLKLYEDDSVDMAITIMQWNDIHHVPVENEKGELVGLLTWNQLDSLKKEIKFNATLVGEVMIENIKTTTPEAEIGSAKELMTVHHIGCLPVVLNGTLVGIISKTDLP